MIKNVLVIGGSSGLGLEIALIFAKNNKVFVTGRHDPKDDRVTFLRLDLDSDSLGQGVTQLLTELPCIDTLAYAAGFYQEGKISDLSDADIEKMNRVGLLASALFLQKILHAQEVLPGFIAITSTSQWTPRLLEPMYTAVKAGLGMLANSVSLDDRVGKVLVVGPGGMSTQFWERSGAPVPKDALKTKWVAEKIIELWAGTFEYKFARVLRGPARVEVVETR